MCRFLPKGDTLRACVDCASWPLPPVFRWLMEVGGVAPTEMARTFNCGVGMVAVVAAEDVAEVRAVFEANGETVFEIGTLQARLAHFCVLKRMPRDESSRTGEPHCGSHCHDRTAAPSLPITLPLWHYWLNTRHSAQAGS